MNKFEVINEEQRTFPEFKFNGRPLTEEESSAFINAVYTAMNPEKKEIHFDRNEDLKNEFLVKILIKRFIVYDLKFSISDIFLIMSITTFADNPGKIMILLRLCYQYWKKTNKSFLGIKEWSEMFPLGVPSEDELSGMWDSQKKEDEYLNNMIDNPVYWRDK